MVERAAVIFDVVALPPETPLIKLAQRLDKHVISGAEVIALQAVEQFALYTGACARTRRWSLKPRPLPEDKGKTESARRAP